MRIVFMGTPDFAVETLEKIIENGYDVVAVVTQPDKPKGRDKKLSPPPVKECALKHNLTILHMTSAIREWSALSPKCIRWEAVLSLPQTTRAALGTTA